MRKLAPYVTLTSKGAAAFSCVAFTVMAGTLSSVFLALAALMLLLIVALATRDLPPLLRPGALSVARRLPARMLQGVEHAIEYTVENSTEAKITVELVDECDVSLSFAQSLIRIACPARSLASQDVPATPRERGELRFRKIYIRVRFGCEFFECRFVVAQPGHLRVYPNFLQRDDGAALSQRSVLLREGARCLQRKGMQGERNGLRAYVPGDSFRAIDFKASARRGSLMVAEQGVERGEQIVLAVDCGRLMTARAGEKSLLDHAVGAALSISAIAREAGDRIGMHAFANDTILNIAPRAGGGQCSALADAASDLQTRFEESDYERAAITLLSQYRKRSFIILFTSLLDPLSSQALEMTCRRLSSRHMVICVLLHDGALENAATQRAGEDDDALAAAVAMHLIDERREALRRLRATQAIVVDAPATHLTMPLLDAYLQVKRGDSF